MQPSFTLKLVRPGFGPVRSDMPLRRQSNRDEFSADRQRLPDGQRH
jgi:hypothetical protein